MWVQNKLDWLSCCLNKSSFSFGFQNKLIVWVYVMVYFLLKIHQQLIINSQTKLSYASNKSYKINETTKGAYLCSFRFPLNYQGNLHVSLGSKPYTFLLEAKLFASERGFSTTQSVSIHVYGYSLLIGSKFSLKR